MSINIRPAFLTKLRKQTRDRNRRFTKLTKARKRVRIAREILALLDAEKIKPASVYLALNDITDKDHRAIQRASDMEVDLSTITSQTKCTVCGIGAMFIAVVRLADKAPLNSFIIGNSKSQNARVCVARQSIVQYLAPYFSYDELDAVEKYFEHGTTSIFNDPTRLDVAFGRNDRLRIIALHIIKNKGKFKP